MPFDEKKARAVQLGFKKSTVEGLTPEEEDELRRIKQEMVKKRITARAGYSTDEEEGS
jgi:hypothetical protein